MFSWKVLWSTVLILTVVPGVRLREGVHVGLDGGLRHGVGLVRADGHGAGDGSRGHTLRSLVLLLPHAASRRRRCRAPTPSAPRSRVRRSTPRTEVGTMRARYSASLEGRVIAVSFDAVPGCCQRQRIATPVTKNLQQQTEDVERRTSVKRFVQTRRRPRPNRDLHRTPTPGLSPTQRDRAAARIRPESSGKGVARGVPHSARRGDVGPHRGLQDDLFETVDIAPDRRHPVSHALMADEDPGTRLRLQPGAVATPRLGRGRRAHAACRTSPSSASASSRGAGWSRPRASTSSSGSTRSWTSCTRAASPSTSPRPRPRRHRGCRPRIPRYCLSTSTGTRCGRAAGRPGVPRRPSTVTTPLP